MPETGKTLVKLRDAFGHRPSAAVTISDKHDLKAAQMADLQLEQDLELLDPELRRQLAKQHRHFNERHFWIDLNTFMTSFDVIYAANCPSMLRHCRDRTTTSMKKLTGGRVARRPLPFVNIMKQTNLVPRATMLSLQLLHAQPALLLEVRQSPAMEPIWISVCEHRAAHHTRYFDRQPEPKGIVVIAHDWQTPQNANRPVDLRNNGKPSVLIACAHLHVRPNLLAWLRG